VAATRALEDVRRMTPVRIPAEQRADVVALSTALDGLANRRPRRAARCQLVGPDRIAVDIPDAVFHVLVRVAEVMARGDAVTVVPIGQALTTQQAAHLLNVSRQYVVRLLDEGRLPFTRTGTHRRLKIEDVLAFKAMRDDERRRALDDLAAESEDVGGYAELK
jgi:excisionase family DNA binding protein